MFFGFLPLYFREFSFLSWNPFVSNEPTATTCVSLFRPPVFYCGDWQVFGLTFWRAFGFFLSFLPVPQSWLSEWWRLWRSKLWRSPSYTSVSSLQSIWIRKPVRQILWFTQKKQDTVTAAFEFYFLSPFLFCFFDGEKRIEKEKQPRWLAVDWKWNETKRSNSCNAVSVLKVITHRYQKEKWVRIVLKWK